MSRCCVITGKKALRGNLVSHANNKTNHFFLPNARKIRLKSKILGKTVMFMVSARGLRTLDKYGGLDAYLQKKTRRRLHEELHPLKRALMKKLKVSSDL
ncbi:MULTISPECIES: 50S ribosomal protein L28 [Holospora]|uniref:Large ribosomal subunit protein bL28 n=2 Tax=Holospora TaxID=44747 RepID=A0A061JH73_9PROT|nr:MULTISPECIES: 50S ribosomal protein L28 [Holospora]ETZ04622.1 50S ribosomal protein L28 [Holospora undulata HU1]GAJ46061.1 50S ribosomal protein L28 [Holospora elegans E1]